MSKTLKTVTWLCFIFLYLPIILLILASFSGGRTFSLFSDMSLHQYGELFKDEMLLKLLLNSVILALLAAVIATVLGTAASIGIVAMNKRMRAVVMNITNIPMTNPDIVTGVSLALLFVFFGRMLNTEDIMGFGTLLIAHITFCLPYVLLSVMPKLKQLDPHLNEAALDLGCTPAQSFFKVILPEIMPGVIAGSMMAFTMSLDDFVISYFVYGPKFVTLPVEIYNYTKKPLPPKIYALFTLLFTIVLVVMVLMNLLQARDSKRTDKRVRFGALGKR